MRRTNTFKWIMTAWMFTMLVFFPAHSVFAGNNSEAGYQAEAELGITIDYDSEIPLYDGNDTVVARKYSLQPTGYVILSENTHEMIEMSEEADNTYLQDKEEKYYYNGPLAYFYEDEDGDIVDCTSLDSEKVEIEKEELHVVEEIESEMEEETASDIMYAGGQPATPRGDAIIKPLIGDHLLSRLTYPYSHKATRDGNCGSVAAAIMLRYYDTYISDKFVSDKNETSDGINLIETLVPYIEFKNGGSSQLTLCSGINTYLVDQGIKTFMAKYVARSDKTRNMLKRIQLTIDNNLPCMVALINHPTYRDHWVVCTGYNSLHGMLYVNDGWGSRNVVIQSSYAMYAVYFGKR